MEWTSGAFHRSKHLVVLLFERASRCYELTALTLDAFPSVSSSGMRLVPETNTQKPSVPRLNYKAFVGARPARSRRR